MLDPNTEKKIKDKKEEKVKRQRHKKKRVSNNFKR